MPEHILEQVNIDEAAFDAKTGRVPIQILTPGWGSSGYYSPKVVEEAASLFKANTPMFLDHATDAERHERPIRSVKEIAGTFTKDAVWNGKALVTEAQLVGPYKEALLALRKTIGVSINGSASDIIVGEAEGRKGPIIEGLAAIESVDFVTRAGRGGKILVESAIREHAVLTVTESVAKDLGVDEATASDRMSHLRSAVRAAHASDGRSAWVRDQDAEKATVWFDVHAGGEAKTYEQGYKVGDNDVDVELTGDPTEVRPVTNYVPVSQKPATEGDLPAGEANERLRSAKQTDRLLREENRQLKEQLAKYVPVTRPDSKNPTTEDDQEVTMGNIQIEESEHKALTEKAGRVDALESERDTEKAARLKAEEALAARDRDDAARKVVTERATEAQVQFSTLEQDGLLTKVTVKEDGSFDTEAFTKVVDEAAAAKKAAGGAGSITGFGGTATGQGAETVSESDIDKAVAGAFGRPVKEA